MQAAKLHRPGRTKSEAPQEGEFVIGRRAMALTTTAIRRRRFVLLSGTALSLGAAFSLAGPSSAQADCVASGSNPVVITCDDTTTENIYNPPNNDVARNQTFADDIEAEVLPNATVDGYGLRIDSRDFEEVFVFGNTITMVHSGDAVILEPGNEDADTAGGAFGPGALELNGNGGLVSYTGTGDIHNQTTTGAGLLVTNDGEIQIDHSVGTITAPGIGIYAASTGADSDVTVSAGGTVQGGDGSILAQATGNGDATINLLDGAIMDGRVLALSELGDAVITAGDNVTALGSSPGAASITAGGDAIQVWGDNAFISGSSGLVVDQTLPGGLGDAIVDVGANGEIIGDGTDATDDYNGNGIFAGNQGIGLTSVTTGAGTSVTGEANGIVAFQTDPQSVSTITVVTGGPVTGNGDIPFVLSPYTDAFVAAGLPTTGLGIGVSNEGTGNIVVSAGDTVRGANTGIQTLAAGGGDTSITTEAAVVGGVNGIHSIATADGQISILANGRVRGNNGDGILTRAVDGDTAIHTGAAVVGGIDGIDATAVGDGAIAIQADRRVNGAAGDGIVTLADDGDTAILTNGVVTGGIDGIDATARTTGDIAILANKKVTGTAGDGILTSTVDGNTAIQTGAAVSGGIDGIHAISTGAGNIAILADGPVTGITGDGILTSTVTGNTAIQSNTAVTGAIDGIHATGAGNIAILTNGPVTGIAGDGILTSSTGGNTAIQANGAVTGGVDGIDATATGAGTIAIATNGAIEGETGDGIVTLAAGGNTAIAVGDDVLGGDDGIDATATGAGDIAIDVDGGAEVTGLTGSGITTTTAGGTATIENGGLIEGAFAAISGATGTVLEVINQAGGVISNLSGSFGDLAISVTGTGVADIDNDGTIIGRVTTDAGNDTLVNSGTWATTGLNDFGAGNNTIVNSGLLIAAEDPSVAEDTHLANIDSFTNTSTGAVTLADDNDPNVHDTLTIDGTYTGQPGSTVTLDLALVAGDPQAGTDVLTLDPANPATGTTDLLFNIVSTGVTATTADTGRVGFAGGQFLDTPVTVVENRGTLATSSGDDDIPLARSGLINYDLVSTAPAGGDYQVVSTLDSGLAGGILLPIHATLAAVAFTTQRTPNPITATCIDPDNKPNAQGGWARVFGADFETQTAGKATTNGTVGELESENRTRFTTLQGGFDHVLCNLDGEGGNLHLGVTVGHTFGVSRQTNPEPLAGIFGTDVEFDTFFAGPYAAYTRGDLAIQASVRFDHHSLDLTNPTAGLDAHGIGFDASAVSGTTAVSYDFEVREDLTITPEIGMNVSRTDIDKFDIAGGTVILDDLWSAVGHAGVTARTTIPVADKVFVIPFASATLYHEFVESAEAALIIGPTTIDVEANRIGTFGQLGIGANAVRLGDVIAGRPTLFGGARFDLQMGERFEGATATVFGRIQF
jgi:hypothetical protein